MSTEGRVEVIALAGMPEVAAGADLAALIGDALETTRGILPLEPDDVLVVTQKIVSKAEGATVDLRTVTPSPDAIAWADASDGTHARSRWCSTGGPRRPPGPRRADHGDPPRVRVRQRGHGREQRWPRVWRPRHDPPARPGRIRGPDPRGDPHRFGTDLAVIVSDSFGRPWRWGIPDVAIGISGLLPLEDLRGTADADGRVMESTVRCVADEIASAAELALGKIAGRPVALVRGARAPRARDPSSTWSSPRTSTFSADPRARRATLPP